MGLARFKTKAIGLARAIESGMGLTRFKTKAIGLRIRDGAS